MQHAVLDTNILVSALIGPEGPPGSVMTAALRGDLVPVFSDDILAEYHEVLQRRRQRLHAPGVQAMLTNMRLVGVRLDVESIPPPPGLPDPADWPFAACAVAAGCPLITGNAKDFPPMTGLHVMTARKWLDQTAPQGKSTSA